MAKKLKVLTPQTTDGVNLKYNANKQAVMKESILELGARKNLESLNAKLPSQLKSTFEVIEVEDAPTGASNAELKKKLESLEAKKENSELLKKIASLEDQLAEKEKVDVATAVDTAKKTEAPAEAAAKIAAVDTSAAEASKKVVDKVASK